MGANGRAVLHAGTGNKTEDIALLRSGQPLLVISDEDSDDWLRVYDPVDHLQGYVDWEHLVVIDDPTKGGHYGAEVAAPVVQKVLQASLESAAVPPTADFKVLTVVPDAEPPEPRAGKTKPSAAPSPPDDRCPGFLGRLFRSCR